MLSSPKRIRVRQCGEQGGMQSLRGVAVGLQRPPPTIFPVVAGKSCCRFVTSILACFISKLGAVFMKTTYAAFYPPHSIILSISLDQQLHTKDRFNSPIDYLHDARAITQKDWQQSPWLSNSSGSKSYPSGSSRSKWCFTF
jgi:hypothetical protein